MDKDEKNIKLMVKLIIKLNLLELDNHFLFSLISILKDYILDHPNKQDNNDYYRRTDNPKEIVTAERGHKKDYWTDQNQY